MAETEIKKSHSQVGKIYECPECGGAYYFNELVEHWVGRMFGFMVCRKCKRDFRKEKTPPL